MTRNEDDDDFVSKSAKKRDMNVIHDLATHLVELSQGDFDSLSLDEDLRREIVLARKVSAHGAKRRQVRFLSQYISQMEHGSVQKAVADLKRKNDTGVARFHELEKLRDQLIAGDESAIGALLERFPGADRQEIRTLQRNAQKQGKSPGGAPRAARAIFRYLKEVSERDSSPKVPPGETEEE